MSSKVQVFAEFTFWVNYKNVHKWKSTFKRICVNGTGGMFLTRHVCQTAAAMCLTDWCILFEMHTFPLGHNCDHPAAANFAVCSENPFTTWFQCDKSCTIFGHSIHQFTVPFSCNRKIEWARLHNSTLRIFVRLHAERDCMVLNDS